MRQSHPFFPFFRSVPVALLSWLSSLLFSSPLFAASAAVSMPVALFGRLHFPLLHFPLVLLFVVVLLEVVLRGREVRAEINSRLLSIAAGLAVITVLAGLAYAQGEDFDGASADTFALHRGIGIAVAVVCVLLVLVQRSKGALSRAYGPLLLVGVGGVGVTAHLGGELVHGQGFYTRPLQGGDKGQAQPGDDTPIVSYDDGDGVDARVRFPEGPIPDKPDYETHIQPLLQRSCVKCHGPEKRKSGLRLDQKRYALKGGESGPTALVPGDADQSAIFTMAAKPSDDEDVMPSKGKLLSLSEIETLKRWIDQGAHWPEKPSP